jgi:hypothetical protein
MGDSKADQAVEENIVTLDRRSSDRRDGDRRTGQPDALETSEFKTPRKRKQRRRHIDPTTCERDYSDHEIEFMRAMDDYKRDSGRMFPTCSEVLEVIRALGYHKLTGDQLEELGLAETEPPNDSESHEDGEFEDGEFEDGEFEDGEFEDEECEDAFADA